MRSRNAKHGFTLVELIVVIAILAILAAILFPIFKSARASAYKVTCISNFRNTSTAMSMYLGDYDDRFMLVNQNIEHLGNADRDRTWVQSLIPYMKAFGPFHCPADTGQRPKSAGIFDVDLMPSDTYRRYYQASLRSNIGYNYLYFSPVYRQGGNWTVRPRSFSQISDVNRTLVAVDSVYERQNGIPTGGGSYIVIPPCRYMQGTNGNVDSFFVPASAELFVPNPGWVLTDPLSRFRYGLAWAWHEPKMNVAWISGGAKSVSTSFLTSGCDVKDNWGGYIKDSSAYTWD